MRRTITHNNTINWIVAITYMIAFFACIVAGKSQTVMISGASNPYFKYNLRVNDTLSVLDRVLAGSGSVSTPGYSFVSASNYGLYYTSNRISMAINGVERFRFRDGELSVSDNGVFDQQLIFNLSHDGTSQDGGINSTTYSTTYGNTFTGRLAGGTGAAPTATPINGKLAEFTGKGYTGAAFSTSNRGLFGIYSAQTFSVGNEGTRAIIKTTPVGSNTLTNVMVFEENGSVAITPNDTLNENYPSGFSTTNARWLEITATGTGADVGVFLQNRSFTKGFQLWHDNSGATMYFDDFENNNASKVQFRAKTSGTPVNILSYTGAGVLGIGNADNTTFNNSGVITKYNAINTTGTGVPVLVATVALTAQGAAIPATAIYTAPADGIYVIHWMAKVTRAATTSSTVGPFNIQYTDAVDNVVVTNSAVTINNYNQNASNSTSISMISGSYTVNAKSGTSINYIMGYTSSGATSMQYTLQINVMQIK